MSYNYENEKMYAWKSDGNVMLLTGNRNAGNGWWIIDKYKSESCI